MRVLLTNQQFYQSCKSGGSFAPVQTSQPAHNLALRCIQLHCIAVSVYLYHCNWVTVVLCVYIRILTSENIPWAQPAHNLALHCFQLQSKTYLSAHNFASQLASETGKKILCQHFNRSSKTNSLNHHVKSDSLTIISDL